MTRLWPWTRRRVEEGLPPLDDGRGEAWAAVNQAQHQLAATRAMTRRVHRVRRDLLAERAQNHFAEAIASALQERRHP